MNFASPIFLFAFLPLVLIAYHLLRPIRAKNVLLIAAGLVLFFWQPLKTWAGQLRRAIRARKAPPPAAP